MPFRKHEKLTEELTKIGFFDDTIFRNMFGVFEGDNSRTKIFIKNEKMKLESLEDTRLDGVDSLHMFPPFLFT